MENCLYVSAASLSIVLHKRPNEGQRRRPLFRYIYPYPLHPDLAQQKGGIVVVLINRRGGGDANMDGLQRCV